MKLSDECVKALAGSVEHVLDGNGPASMTVYEHGTKNAAGVVFVIPAPAGPLVNKFLNELYALLGWRTEEQ